MGLRCALPALILHVECLMLWSKLLFGWSVLRSCACVCVCVDVPQFIKISSFVSPFHFTVIYLYLYICVYINTSTQKEEPSKKKWKRSCGESQSWWFSFFFFLIFKKLFIYLFNFWLRWVFIAVGGLSLVAASGGYSSLWCTGCSLRWLLLLWSMGSRHVGFSSCSMWAQ